MQEFCSQTCYDSACVDHRDYWGNTNCKRFTTARHIYSDGGKCYGCKDCKSPPSYMRHVGENAQNKCKYQCNSGTYYYSGNRCYIGACPDSAAISACTSGTAATGVYVCTGKDMDTCAWGGSAGSDYTITSCSGGYYKSGNGCYDCSAGKYSSGGTTSSCSTCACGRYSAARSSSCSVCSAGTYSSSEASSCTAVSSGYFTSSSGSCSQTFWRTCHSSQQEDVAGTTTSDRTCKCKAGYWRSSKATGLTDSETCSSASEGYYVSGAGSTSETKCAAGTYQASTGQTSCVAASRGYYVPSAASTRQFACSQGTYQDQTGQLGCIQCAANYWRNIVGATICYPHGVCTHASVEDDPDKTPSRTADRKCRCTLGYYRTTGSTGLDGSAQEGSYLLEATLCTAAAAGRYVDAVAQVSQKLCAKGYYQPNTAQTSCLQSGQGFYVATSGSSSRSTCAKGYRCPNNVNTAQTACLEGTYQPQTQKTTCLNSGYGWYVPTTASASRTACAVGYRCPEVSNPAQIACAKAYYQPNTKQTSCLRSEKGYYVDTAASSSRTICEPGTYCPLDANEIYTD